MFPEHHFQQHPHQQPQPKPKPVWATHGSRSLTLAVLYRRYALDVADRRSLLVPERRRQERQFTLSQTRIIGRRGVRPSAGFLGALGKGSGVALGLALVACRELDGLPINQAVIAVNREFGWREQR